MTATETEKVFFRTFTAELVEGDGRTVVGRIVPYNEVAFVADPPDFTPYQEMFMPGAFVRQLSTPGRDRVLLNFEHEQGIGGALGNAVEWRDQQDGLHGTFRVLDVQDGDKALTLLREGFLTGFSIEFAASKTRSVDGVKQRYQAQLNAVSLCRFPAYQGAEVLAVREKPLSLRHLLPEPNTELDETLERLERRGMIQRRDSIRGPR